MFYIVLWVFFGVLGCSRQISFIISYTAAVTFHFFLNRSVIFQASREDIKPQVVKYITVLFLNYLLQAGIVEVLSGKIGLSLYVGSFCGVVVSAPAGYFLLNRWVYASRNSVSQNY